MPDSAIVLARETDAQAILEGDGPLVATSRWPSVGLGSMLTIEVGSLAGIVLGLDQDGIDRLASAEPHTVAEGSPQDGPWIWRLPSGFREALEPLDEAGVTRAAKAWAATEELQGYDLAEVERIVGELVSLAKGKESASQTLLLWCEL